MVNQQPAPAQGAAPSALSVRALVDLCQQAGVQELEAADGKWSIRLRLDLVESNAVSIAVPEVETEQGPAVLLSEWVGIFHRAPEGDAEPYAHTGRPVKLGALLGVVAAMQLQHELRAEREGMLLRFLVEDGMPVEYGQGLVELG